MPGRPKFRNSKKVRAPPGIQRPRDHHSLVNAAPVPPKPVFRSTFGEDEEVKEPVNSVHLGCKRHGLHLSRLIGEIVMPGDEFTLTRQDGVVVLGPGLQLKTSSEEDEDTKIVIVNKSGVLIKGKPNAFYIEMTSRAYLPYKQDDVVGVITKRTGDQYVVDIGTRDRVILSKFAFEGATKKNKPDLKIGDVVFARFLDLPSDFPFELSCVTSSGKAMGLGPLENGLLLQVPAHLVKLLQSSKKQGGSDVLKKLGEIVPFEVVVGVNGYVWVKSKDELTTILISQAIQATANLKLEEHDSLLPVFRTSLESIQGII